MKHLLIVLTLVSFGAALSAEDRIVRSTKLPKSTPWDLKALSTAPEFDWVDEEGPVRSLFYAGESYRGRPTRVFAYYASPATLGGSKSKGPWPAVVLVHGGGGTAFREWVELWAKRGYAAIAMDLAGHRPIEGKNPHQRANRTRLEDGGPGQGDDEKFGSVDSAAGEQWPYHAVANVVRAHSLIRGFDEVDAERTAVTGISWGGYLTCIVAGVDNRFRAAVPVYGCGFLHENSVWIPRFGKMTEEQRARWVTLWDPSRYLPAVTMPILFVNGTNDFAYPLDSYTRSFDSVPGTKQLRITVNLPHSHPAGWAPVEIARFVDQYCRDGAPLPVLETVSLENGGVDVEWSSSVPVKKVTLHATADETPINKRKWTSTEGSITGNRGRLPAPPEDATAWFVTIEDERGATVSSRVTIRPSDEVEGQRP